MKRARTLGLLAILSACGGQTVTARTGLDPEAGVTDAPDDAGPALDDAGLALDVVTAAPDVLPREDRVAPPDLALPEDLGEMDVPELPMRPDVLTDVLTDAPTDVPRDVPVDAPRCEVTDVGSALGDGVASGSTAAAPNLRRGTCGGEAGPEVVLRWTAPRAGTFTFTTAGSDFDTLLYLRASCDGPDAVCNDDVVSGVVRSSTATVTLDAGEPVFVIIDGWEDSAGNYVLNIAEGGPVRCTAGRTRTCYGGPMGTQGVGRCAAVTQTCLPQGVWPDLCRGDVRPAEAEVCANRVDDDCDGMTDEGCAADNTRVVQGRVTYERRVPDSARRDWTTAPDAPAPGFAVYSFRGEQMIDAAVTSVEAMREGTFSLRVPATPASNDRVVVAALHRDARGIIRYAVANPGVAPGTYAPHTASDRAAVWSWSWRADALPMDGTLRITRAQGAGAAVTFEHLGRAVREAETRYARTGYSLLAWQGVDVSWSCGACFSVTPTQRFAQGFTSQISMFGGAEDESYWSPSTITHEAGHWVMASYGVSPREGGTHYLNTPESPGLAWSEGWATWYGAALRNDPVLVSKQRGFMYWFDIGARRLSSGRPWALPSAMGALTQPIAENEVSAILWALAPAPRNAVYAGLNAPRMTRSPFLRGYRNPQGANVPFLPDFLDALRCAGVSADAVTAAARPYPYPAAMPLCNAMDEAPPLTVTFREEPASGVGLTGVSGELRRVVATITAGVTLDAPIRLRVVAPAGARVLAGGGEFSLSEVRPGSVLERAVTLRFAGAAEGELRVEAEVEVEGFGLHGAAPWRFGRAATVTAELPRARALRVSGVDLGPSVTIAP